MATTYRVVSCALCERTAQEPDDPSFHAWRCVCQTYNVWPQWGVQLSSERPALRMVYDHTQGAWCAKEWDDAQEA